MESYDEISGVINALRSLTGIGICYYDLNSFFHYERYGVKNNRGHYCAFCTAARALPDGRRLCEKSDRAEAVALARQYRAPFFFTCHLGMGELILPLMNEQTLIGVVFVGQCRSSVGADSRTVAQNVKKLGGDPDAFIRMYEELPTFDRDALLSIGTILLRYFDSKIRYKQLLTPLAGEEPARDPATAAKRYLDAHYMDAVTTASVARMLFVNESHLARCFRRVQGVTLTAYLTNLRVERARHLLATTSVPIGNLALNLGFADANYFSRVFRRQTGCTPQEYRKRTKG